MARAQVLNRRPSNVIVNDRQAEARRLLVEFVADGASPVEVRKRDRARLDSSRRDWKIKAAATSHGSYDRSVVWPMTAADVVAGGSDHYSANVRAWAQLINEALKAML